MDKYHFKRQNKVLLNRLLFDLCKIQNDLEGLLDRHDEYDRKGEYYDEVSLISIEFHKLSEQVKKIVDAND